MPKCLPTVIITGANGNVGSALAAEFADEGFRLILLYHRSMLRLEEIVKKHPDTVRAVQSDIRNLEEMQKRIGEVVQESGFNPQVLIHTAAMRSIDSAPLSETTPTLWQQIIETNITGTYNILKVVIPIFQAEKQSANSDGFCRIILFGSDVSRSGLPFGSAYAASKSAVANISRSLATELAENNILINTVSPGPVEIDDSHFSDDYRRFRAKYYEEMLKRTPLKRLAKVSDIISLCRYLISDYNNYLTGDEFFLTGGKL